MNLPTLKLLHQTCRMSYPSIKQLDMTGKSNENKLDILIVDDNAIYRKILNKMITKHLPNKFNKICEADNPEKGLALLNKHNFDLVFMDIDMPIMSGLQTTRIIRGKDQSAFDVLESNRKVPIIACTTNDTKDDIESYHSAGMDGFIAKPILPSNLKEAIDSTLKLKTLKTVQTNIIGTY